jgi:hypothetical protein
MVHALAVWLAFLAGVHLARLVLFPTFGSWGGVIAFVLVYVGVIGLFLMRVGGVGAPYRAPDPPRPAPLRAKPG